MSQFNIIADKNIARAIRIIDANENCIISESYIEVSSEDAKSYYPTNVFKLIENVEYNGNVADIGSYVYDEALGALVYDPIPSPEPEPEPEKTYTLDEAAEVLAQEVSQNGYDA